MSKNTTHITYSVSLLFDKFSSSYVNNIISNVATLSKNTYHLDQATPPHITIGMFKAKEDNKNDKEEFLSSISPLLDNFTPFNLSLCNIDTLKDKVLIGKFSCDSVIKALNEKAYELLIDKYVSCCNNQYVPNNFYPHITFATGLTTTQIKEVEEYCSTLELPKILKVEHTVLAIKSPYTPFYVK